MDTSTAVAISKVSIDGGDVPTWLLVIVSASGVWAAFQAGRYAKGVYGSEIKRDEWREEQEERSQAVLVSGWAVLKTERSSVTMPFTLAATVFNASNQPIYNVDLIWLVDGVQVFVLTHKYNLIRPNDEHAWPITEESYLAIGEPLNSPAITYEAAKDIVARSRLVITFDDSEGRTWTRDQTGHLERAPKQD